MTFYITLKANIKVYYHLKAIRIETHFCQTKTGYFFIDQRNHHKVKDEGPLSITGLSFYILYRLSQISRGLSTCPFFSKFFAKL